MLKSRSDLQHSGTLGDNGLVKKSFRHFNNDEYHHALEYGIAQTTPAAFSAPGDFHFC